MAAESKLEQRVCKYMLEKHGVANAKWGDSGWPDRIFLVPGGRPVFVEFKAPGEVPMPRQAYRIKCLRTWGYKVFIHDNFDESICDIIAAMDATQVPKEGDKIPFGTRVRSPALGPRVGKIIDNTRSNQSPQGKGVAQQGIDYSATKGVLQRVARRGGQVARLLGPKSRGTT